MEKTGNSLYVYFHSSQILFFFSLSLFFFFKQGEHYLIYCFFLTEEASLGLTEPLLMQEAEESRQQPPGPACPGRPQPPRALVLASASPCCAGATWGVFKFCFLWNSNCLATRREQDHHHPLCDRLGNHIKSKRKDYLTNKALLAVTALWLHHMKSMLVFCFLSSLD